MRTYLNTALGLAFLVATGQAAATGFDVQAGSSHSAPQDNTATLWFQSRGSIHSLGGHSNWQREAVGTVGFIGDRDRDGYRDQVLLVGGGQRLQHLLANGQPSHWFIEGNLMLAAGRTRAISGPIQFATAIGWDNGRYQIVVRHVSNGGLSEPNRGETMLLLGKSF